MIPTLLLLAASVSCCAATPPSISVQDIRDTFGRAVAVTAIEARGDTLYSVEIVPLPAGDPLHEFVSANRLWLTYVVQHGYTFDMHDVSAHGLDSASVTASFAHHLVADSAFNAIAVPAAAQYLRAKGWTIRGEKSPVQRRRIALSDVIPIAVRFFYPDALTSGGIRTHICTQLNAIRTLPTHDIALEAFLFQAIMGDAQGSWTLRQDFDPAKAMMNRLDAPGPVAERLNRAQGVMWGAMAQSARLRRVILEEERRSGTLMPFEIRS